MPPRTALSSEIALLVALLCLASCESTPANTQESDDETADTGGETGETGDAEMPTQCEGLSTPFVEAECLSAAQARCRAHASEQACADACTLVFDEGSFVIRCAWARVVTFADADACTVESEAGRCEAALEQTGLGCGDSCQDPPDLYASLWADTTTNELIDMPCAPAGYELGGPLGPWSAIGADNGAETGACVDGTTEPKPTLCSCAAVACATD